MPIVTWSNHSAIHFCCCCEKCKEQNEYIICVEIMSRLYISAFPTMLQILIFFLFTALSNQLANLSPKRRICGILGTIHLIGGDYLIVATHRLYVGMIDGGVIWRLAGYDLIPYIPTTTHLTPKQREHNETYLQMLRKTLDTNHFYFSYNFDITHTQQRLHTMAIEERQQCLYERADKRFVWNGALLSNFNCNEMRNFQLPLILGCK